MNKNILSPDGTKQIHITYYAHLRQQRGLFEEYLITTASTAHILYNELKDQYNFKLSQTSLKVSINDELSDWNTRIKVNDHIVFIPPVSGG